MDYQPIENFFGITGVLGLFLSIILLIIHLSKYLKTNTEQTLATRNLSVYCWYLLISYILYFTSQLWEEYIRQSLYYYLINSFIHILLSCSLLVMTFDTYLCLKNTVAHLSISSLDSNRLKFPIYRAIELILALLFTSLLLLLKDKYVPGWNPENNLTVRDYLKISIILTIRIICVVLFIASVIYLNMARIMKKNLLNDFSMYLRLLVMTGVIYIPPNLIHVYFLINKNKYEDSFALIDCIVDNFTLWEGFIIGLLFTFKKNTFRKKQDRSVQFSRNISKSLSMTLTPKVSVVSNLYRDEKINEKTNTIANE